MAFFKAKKIKVNGVVKYIPMAVVQGKPVSTETVAEALAKRSTVSVADCFAVLKEMGDVMADFMAQGKSVRLEGIGTFRLTIDADKEAADKPEDVKASHIKNTRVRFVPETKRTAAGAVSTRAGISKQIEWVRSDGMTVADGDGSGGDTGGDGGDSENPMG